MNVCGKMKDIERFTDYMKFNEFTKQIKFTDKSTGMDRYDEMLKDPQYFRDWKKGKVKLFICHRKLI
jgi:hypothetical protein